MTVALPSPETAPRSVRDWRHDALCRSYDPEIWWPVGSIGPQAEQQIARAKEICGRCPVEHLCGAWAIEALAHGVAGGLTAEEREQIRQDRSADQFGLPIVGVS